MSLIFNLTILISLGCVVALVGDLVCHVWTGVLTYPYSNAFNQATWMPWGAPGWVLALFSTASISLVYASRLFVTTRALYSSKKPVPPSGLLRTQRLRLLRAYCAGSWFLATYALSGYLPQDTFPTGGMRDVVLGGMAIASWILFDTTGGGLLYSLLVGFTGIVVETLVSKQGVFFYSKVNSNWNGHVPSWLGLLYIPVAIAGIRIGDYLLG
eukprot:PhF_6_TR19944/c0_g1_i7/m.29031